MILRALVNTLVSVELAGEDAISLDFACELMEEIAYELQRLPDEERDQFVRAERMRQLPEMLGLTSA